MNILGIIPARGGSKGIPRKNIKLLGDKPLMQYTFESAISSKNLSEIILSSDSSEIISVAKMIGIHVPFKRPAEIAKDHSLSLEVVQHALKFYLKQNIHFDAVCLLQPTSPFREKNLIDKAIEKFEANNYDSLVTVRKVPDEFNPHWIYEENGGLLKLATGENEIISRRQELPPAYYRDGSIYITRSEVILDKKSLYGQHTGFIDCSKSLHVNLDTPEDWLRAEEILDQQNN